MKKNKLIKGLIISCLFVTLLPSSNIEAIDFEGQEDRYIKLCSSRLSSANKVTCVAFNKYLDEKYDKINDNIKESKKELENTFKDIKEVSEQIDQLTTEITKVNNEIEYISTSIKNLEDSIIQKENEMKERLYVMQSTYNSNMIVNFIFGAEDFTTLFSRLSSLTDITSYEKQIMKELSIEKESLDLQKANLVKAKETVKAKVETQKVLQDQLVELKAKQQAQIKNDQNEANEISAAQKKIDAALEALISNAPSGSLSSSSYAPGTSEAGNAIAQKALSRLGSRYWWGAPGGGFGDGQGLDNPNAIYFDCSGLVAWAHRQSGIKIGRNTAAGYASSGVGVSRAELQPGDVITFNYGSGVTHIGIYIGNNSFVHASGYGSGVRGQYASQCVQVAKLDDYWTRYVFNYRRLY